MRSLSDFLVGPEPDPFPYGPPNPFQTNSRNKFQNQYGLFNAPISNSFLIKIVGLGVYAGINGGQSITGPRGPYGGRNTNIGGSYAGLSGWPLFPWFPTILPPTTTTTTTPTTTTTTTTSTTTTTVTPIVQTIPLEGGEPTIVEVPVDAE